MLDPKASKHLQPKISSRSKSSSETMAFSGSVSSQDQIRERAHQLYESRGCQDGQAQQDWLTAEQEILNQH
jgi:hypothetical protein